MDTKSKDLIERINELQLMKAKLNIMQEQIRVECNNLDSQHKWILLEYLKAKNSGSKELYFHINDYDSMWNQRETFADKCRELGFKTTTKFVSFGGDYGFDIVIELE